MINEINEILFRIYLGRLKMCMQKLVTFAEKLFYEKVFIIVCFHVIFNDV